MDNYELKLYYYEKIVYDYRPAPRCCYSHCAGQLS